jgi:hypothetical protein
MGVLDPDDPAARLAEQLAAALDDDPAYERHGVLESSPWGSGQWVKFTDPEGKVHYLRIVVEPYRPG